MRIRLAADYQRDTKPNRLHFPKFNFDHPIHICFTPSKFNSDNAKHICSQRQS